MTYQPVAPSRTDPVAAAFSEVVGGPVGRHARPHRWWTPVRVLLVMGAVVMCLAIVRSQPCLATHWSSDEARYGKMCYSDVPYLYTGRGFAEGRWPYSDDGGRFTTIEYPVGIAYFAYVIAELNQVSSLTRDGPPIDQRRATPADQTYTLPGIAEEIDHYYLLTSVFLAIALLGGIWLMAGAHRGRPWDALPFVASPVLLATALINWDLLAVVCVAGVMWAWARDRPTLTGVLIGVGTAVKLYPLFLLGPVLIIAWRRKRPTDAVTAAGGAAIAWSLAQLPALATGSARWKVFWTFNEGRGADWGSVWLLLSHLGRAASVETINRWSWILFALVCVAVLILGLRAPKVPRLAQLGYLVVLGFLLVNKVYSPQYALWLLPLAVLARPRWRDLLIWQAGEVLYVAAIWLNLGGWLTGSQGDATPAYDAAIVVRILAELYLAFVIVRDVLSRRVDPYGLAEDDPVDVGGGEPHADLDLLAHGRHV